MHRHVQRVLEYDSWSSASFPPGVCKCSGIVQRLCGVAQLMRLLPLLPVLMLSSGACDAVRHSPEWAPREAFHDLGTIAGSWREVRRNGRRVHQGSALSISSFVEPTFAVQRGCVATGGLLRPLAGNAYRVERYESGYSIEGCGPWRSGPEVAPFDRLEISLIRHGPVLVAEGGGDRVEFRRLPVPVI
jgi:hypothetical protein